MLAHEWQAGPADAPVLVLLHGWGLHSGVWRDFLPLLAEDFRVLCIDLPGFGKNVSQPVDTLAAAIDGVLEVAPAKAVWLGWSLGGLLALELAARHPQRVQALLMMAATPCFVQRGDWAVAMPADVFRQFRAAVDADATIALAHFLALQCKGSVTMKDDLRFLKALVQETEMPATQSLLAGLDWLQQTDARQRLASLKVPAGFLLGQNDALLPSALADALPRACHCTVMAGAAHLPFVSHAVQSVAVLKDFCRRAGVPA